MPDVSETTRKRRPSLTDEIAAVMRERVLSSDFKPGDRLPSEQQLADSFDVSRPVIREAISKLKHEGLIDTRQGLGAFVTDSTERRIRFDPSEQPIRHVFELRAAVEPVIAALAARRRTKDNLKELERTLDALRQAVASGTGAADADVAFHGAVAEATANPIFRSLMQAMQPSLHRGLHVSHVNVARVGGRLKLVYEEHLAIYQAILERDADGAHAAGVRHLKKAAARLSIELRDLWFCRDA